ncbi:hypothetical protein [Edaphobacter aggregans]|uniref:hypothetical protein n=1 Tax=Edaphobacter aggregans TaxID=570835 RepID=UPI0012FC974F|nr:hypothetical protein [Edaphobacter aggregans]
MTLFPKMPPSAVRPGPSMSPNTSGTRFPEPRPYLIPSAIRRSGLQEKHTLPLFPHESEDARLTGATRSLYRRLLALNLPVVVAESVTVKKTTQTSFGKIA